MTTTRRAALAALLASSALVVTSCGEEDCASAPPDVQAVASCSAHPGEAVNLPVRLCPDCHQSGATCAVIVDEAEHVIQLDTRVQACETGSCDAACDVQPFACSFTAPSTEGSYDVLIIDGGTSEPFNAPDFVVTSGATSCGLALRQ
ncbi:MAG: hypothetical protein QM767_12490 [Anaeromyxobacter sp.]